MRGLAALLIVVMALSTKVTSFNTGTGAAGTTIDVTLGFQPKAIWVWWSGRTETTDTVGRADSHVGWGFGKDSSNRLCWGWARDDAAAAETGGQAQRDDSVVFRITTAGAADGALDIDATANWPSDGIRFIVDTQFGASMRVHLAAIGGTDITDVVVATAQDNASVGNNFDVTSLSFQPDVVFMAESAQIINNITTGAARFVFSAAISASKQATHSLMFDPGATSGDGGEYCLEGPEVSGVLNASTATDVIIRKDFVQMLSNGFRLHRIESSSSVLFGYMAIKGGQWDIGSLLTQTDTTTDITGSPSLNSQTPKLIFFESACRAESTADAATVPTRWSKGAATGASEEAAMAEHGEDASANTRIGTAVEHDACYINLADVANDGDPQTIQGSMHVTATGPNSFTCRMTDADPSQSFVWWVAVSPNAEAPGGLPIRPGVFTPRFLTQRRLSA